MPLRLRRALMYMVSVNVLTTIPLAPAVRRAVVRVVNRRADAD
jgi:hypothetical protein